MEKETQPPVWKGGPQAVAGVLMDIIHVELVLVVREGGKPEENLQAQICEPLKELRPLEPAAVFWFAYPTATEAAIDSTSCTKDPDHGLPPWYATPQKSMP